MNTSAFAPDWASPPGDTISDALRKRRIPHDELAAFLGLSEPEFGRLLRGESTISAAHAALLASRLGATASFWMRRQQEFDAQTEQIAKNAQEDWLADLPIKEMKAFGWLDAWKHLPNLGEACLRFFGENDLASWRDNQLSLSAGVSFRTSKTFESRPGATSAWLRKAMIEANSIECAPWNAAVFRQSLHRAKALSRKKSPAMFMPELTTLCAKSGVALIVLRTPKECKASGATLWISDSKALMVISHRFKTDDHFWFSFFHEAGHLLLHRDRKVLVDFEDTIGVEEDEANAFAEAAIIAPEARPQLRKLVLKSTELVRAARDFGVSPGILVGQLQHEGLLERNRFNKLKRRLVWD